jgi:tetratricopeptide (TPR) repeat protein
LRFKHHKQEIMRREALFCSYMRFFILILLCASTLHAQEDPILSAKIKYNEGLAFVSNGQQNCAQALRYFTEAIGLDSYNPKIHYMKGYCQNKLNQVQDAIASFEAALQHTQYQLNRDEGNAALTTLLSQIKHSIYHAHIRAAAFAAQDKDARKTLRHLNEARNASTEPVSMLMHYYYAVAYNLDKQYALAVEHARAATQSLGFASGERYAPYFYELGYALEFTGSMQEAVRAYEKASYGSKRNLAEERIASIRALYVIY